MAIADDLAAITSLALDTSPIIYAFEEHPDFGPVVRPVFEFLEAGRTHAVVATITVTEVLTAPLRENNEPLAIQYREFFREAAHIELVALDSRIADRAAELRARYGIATADAIIAATALESGCEAILTNDEDLKRVDGMRVLLVADYLKQSQS